MGFEWLFEPPVALAPCGVLQVDAAQQTPPNSYTVISRQRSSVPSPNGIA